MAYFRALKLKQVDVRIDYDYHNVEYFDYRYIDKEILEFIEVIITEISDSLLRKFDYWNEYDYDEYWYLFVTIYPFENRINFRSSCKTREYEEHTEEYGYDGLSNRYSKGFIEMLEVYETTKITVDYNGSWDDFYAGDHWNSRGVRNAEDEEIKLSDKWKDFIYGYLTHEYRRVDEEEGSYGTLIINYKGITSNHTEMYDNYSETDLNYNLTLEDIN